MASPLVRAQKPAPRAGGAGRSGVRRHAGSRPRRRHGSGSAIASTPGRSPTKTSRARRPATRWRSARRSPTRRRPSPDSATLAVEWVPVTVDKRFARCSRERSTCSAGRTRSRWRRDGTWRSRFRSSRAASARCCGRTRPPGCVRSCPGAGRAPLRSGARTPRRSCRRETFSVVAGTTTEKWLAGRIKDLNVVATVAPVNGIRRRRPGGARPQGRRLLRRALHSAGRRQAKPLAGRTARPRPAVHLLSRWRWPSRAATTTSGCSWIGR